MSGAKGAVMSLPATEKGIFMRLAGESCWMPWDDVADAATTWRRCNALLGAHDEALGSVFADASHGAGRGMAVELLSSALL